MMQDLMASTGRLPNRFTVWQDRAPDQTCRAMSPSRCMDRFDWPVLILNGAHDALTPACGMLMHQAIPGSALKIFAHRSQSAFYQEPELCRETRLSFLNAQRGCH